MRLNQFLNENAVKTFYYNETEVEQEKMSGIAEKVVILTKSKYKTKTPQKFAKYCKKHGIYCKFALSDECYLISKDGKLFISNANDDNPMEINPKTTLIINRAVSGGKKSAPLDIITQFEKNKFFCVNTRDTIETCSDKFRTAMRLVEQGVNTPQTCMIRSVEDIQHALEQVGGKFPVVIKTIYGSKGTGVFISESEKSLKSTLQTIWSINPDVELLMQEFIENGGWDYRIHVLADEVIAVMKRLSGNQKKEFRNNFSLGGDVEKVEIDDLPDEVKDLAIKAAKAVSGIWVGVDVIQNQKTKEYTILEVNSSPGTDGIELATGIPVTNLVMDYAIEKKNWVPTTTTCGYIENFWVEMNNGLEIGYMKAKLDTGLGNICSIHGENIKIDKEKETVTWTLHGRTFTSKLIKMKKFNKGGLRDKPEDQSDIRPIVSLTVKFNGDTYKNVNFAVVDRLERMGTELLINRGFMRLAALSVDPSAKYLVSLEEPEKRENKKEMA